MSGVFISYRRGDRPGYAARLTDALERSFGADRVFRDVEDIAPGANFAQVISHRLDEVDVVLALIGPTWLQAGPDGTSRLSDPNDFVRLEILSALNTGTPVWPVLVNGARLPDASELPIELRPLLSRQAVVLSDTGWHADVAQLSAALKPVIRKRQRASSLKLALVALALVLFGAFFMLSSGLIQHKDPSGRWQADVTYEWGSQHRETFELRQDGNTLRGSASYLGVPRLIEEGEYAGGTLRFITRTESMIGQEVRPLTHRYQGQLRGQTLQLRLETTGSPGSQGAVELIAERSQD